MPKSREEYTEANRVAWNEVAPLHAAHNNTEYFEAFRNPEYVTFQREILDTLRRVGVVDKRIIQLCCNNGSETLSLRNLGATYCLGVDAAEEFLEHGREMIQIAGAEEQVELLQSDIYQLPEKLFNSFDMVLITIGVLSWMPDLKGFFEVIQKLLKPGGQLVLEDMHPVLFMYDENESGPSTMKSSYFAREIWEETTGLDYYGKETYDAQPNYSFMHRMDEILMAGINNGLQLVSIKELDYDISFFCSDLENSPTKPPLGFVMVMDKLENSQCRESNV
jgi:ubiquinone/menaquinone biosynthesis C-methylase UbiE